MQKHATVNQRQGPHPLKGHPCTCALCPLPSNLLCTDLLIPSPLSHINHCFPLLSAHQHVPSIQTQNKHMPPAQAFSISFQVSSLLCFPTGCSAEATGASQSNLWPPQSDTAILPPLLETFPGSPPLTGVSLLNALKCWHSQVFSSSCCQVMDEKPYPFPLVHQNARYLRK